jgi:putative sterol carrier protein
MTGMTIDDLRAQLEASFHPPAAGPMDAVLRIQIGADAALICQVVQGTLRFVTDPTLQPDTTFHFADLDTARALLAGRADAFEAFMAGRFRADGYLIWAFKLMAMFRSTSRPGVATD